MLALWSIIALCGPSFTVAARQMEGFIVGGALTKITKFPHSAFMFSSCLGEYISWRCGSSILNQQILLTAAHCLYYDCDHAASMVINIGSEHREEGIVRSASGFLLHQLYNSYSLTCDIALVKISKPLKFSLRIGRVAIMRNPPYNEQAYSAGWGMINEETHEQGILLKELAQKIKKNRECRDIFGSLMPRGTICAESALDTTMAMGDSGSALVVREYIQVGIASVKLINSSKNVLIYTDVGYYYDWIISNAYRLHCEIP